MVIDLLAGKGNKEEAVGMFSERQAEMSLSHFSQNFKYLLSML